MLQCLTEWLFDESGKGVLYYVAQGMESIMAKAIKNFLIKLNINLSIPSEMFCICGGARRYTAPEYTYPSCNEAWSKDWENIGLDFRRAVGRLEAEVAR